MTKEESLSLIKLEKMYAQETPEHYALLIDKAEELIEADLLTYDKYVLDVAETFEIATKDLEEDATVEERAEAIKNMCTTLINKYQEELNGRKKE